MKQIEINIQGANTLRVLETPTGAILILKETKLDTPKLNDPYHYIVFNVMKGFFVWETTWNDSEMDNHLFSAGNFFPDPKDAKDIAEEFNLRLKTRI